MKQDVLFLRQYISEVILSEARSKPPGAGVVVVRSFPEGWRVLGLRVYGRLDIPKGVIDPGESPFQAAVRETSEEAGITDLRFTWGNEPKVVGRLTVWVAETSQDPVIQRNPETGIYEHHSADWLEWDIMLSKVPNFIATAVRWARLIVEEENT